MAAVRLQARSTSDGELTITLPPELAGHDVVVIVTEAESLSGAAWPDGLFEATAGRWQGPRLERPEEGVLEQRRPLP